MPGHPDPASRDPIGDAVLGLKTACLYVLVTALLMGVVGTFIVARLFPESETQAIETFAEITATFVLPPVFVIGWIKGFRKRRGF